MTGRSPLSSPLMAPVAGLRITKPTSRRRHAAADADAARAFRPHRLR